MSEAEPPSAEFRPSGLLVRGVAEMRLLSLSIDGMPIEAVPRRTADGIFIPLPAEARDSLPHAVEATLDAEGEVVSLRGEVQSDYIGHLDTAEEQVAGWIYDASDPAREVVLEVLVDGVPVGTCRTGMERQDVAESGHAALRPGFAMPLPRRSLTAPSLVTLRIPGTGCAPLGSMLSGVGAAAYAGLAEEGGRAAALLRDRVVLPALLHVARGHAPGLALPSGTVKLAPREQAPMGPPVVDVVIPVYRGIEETLDCVRSVIAGRGRIACEILVIFDCGPEPELLEELRGIAATGDIRLLENEENLGFVGTVNRGMRHGTVNDVVLLNSDTVVPPGWLDRLHAAAAADERVGTVTALSNNATICSLPRIGGMDGLPYGATLEEIDAACARANAGVAVDLPTAHGFCMYVKRATIEDVGLFDEEAFGRGYGEENDFSLRAAARGWRNVAACDVFVQHKGSVSFQGSAGELTERNLRIIAGRYPDYHRQVMQFIEADPMHAPRNRVQMAFWRGRDIAVLVTLALGGGVGRHVEDAAARLQAAGMLVLLLSRAPDGPGLQLRAWADAGQALVYPPGPEAAVQAMSDIVALRPRFLHVHHLLDLDGRMAELVAGSGIPYQVTLHDFFYACPRVTLLDESARYCGLPDAAKCTRCIARGGTHPAVHPSMQRWAEDVERWRLRWAGFLGGAARILAPSADTVGHYARIFPELPIAVQAHEEPVRADPPWEPRPQPALIKVAVVGAIGAHKGVERLLNLLRHAERWAEDLHFVVIGFTSEDERIARFANATVTGSYAPEELAARLAEQGAHVALFLSPWPETYSYTLSEALAQGLTPVAYDIGAIAERLQTLGCGVLRPVDSAPPVMVEAIREAACQATAPIPFLPSDPPLPLEGGPAEWAPPAPPRHPALLLRQPDGCFPDGWAARVVEWQLHLESPAEAVELEFWAPAHFAGQFVTVEANGRRIGRHPIRAEDITRLRLHPPARAGLLVLSCRFDFDTRLSVADLRRGSAVLRALVLRIGAEVASWQPESPLAWSMAADPAFAG
jgi:GT2 family glycosyltransferase/glycosyltransferase involved in cell wall biosynthesis